MVIQTTSHVQRESGHGLLSEQHLRAMVMGTLSACKTLETGKAPGQHNKAWYLVAVPKNNHRCVRVNSYYIEAKANVEGVYAQISIPFDSVHTGSIRLKSEDACNGGVLWRSKVDGSQRLQLTSLPMQAWLPRWSMGNELRLRPGFLDNRTESTWLRQTAVGRRSSRQGIITRLTRTGRQTRTRWCSEVCRGLKVKQRVPPPSTCSTLRRAKSQRFLVLRVCTPRIGHPTAATSWPSR